MLSRSNYRIQHGSFIAAELVRVSVSNANCLLLLELLSDRRDFWIRYVSPLWNVAGSARHGCRVCMVVAYEIVHGQRGDETKCQTKRAKHGDPHFHESPPLNLVVQL